jgi:hypothetical protein
VQAILKIIKEVKSLLKIVEVSQLQVRQLERLLPLPLKKVLKQSD